MAAATAVKRTAAKPAEDEGGTDLDAVLKAYDRDQAAKSMFKPQGPGIFSGRILPPAKRGLYYRQFGVHFGVELISPKFADIRAVGCPKETNGTECPICEMQRQLYYEGKANNDETKLNLAKEIRVKVRRVVNFVDMKNPSAGVQTWEYPANTNPNRVSVASKIDSLFAEWKDITHPVTGYVIKLTYEKKEYLTCEDVAITAQQTPIPVENWKEDRKDLDAYAQSKLLPLEKLREMLRDADGSPAEPAAATTTEEHPDIIPGDDERDAATPPAAPEPEPTAPAEEEIDTSDPKVQKILDALRSGKLK